MAEVGRDVVIEKFSKAFCGHLRTGAQWSDLAARYPPRPTCHDRFQQWCRSDTPYHVLQALADDLVERGQLKLSETYVDAMFASAK